MKPEKLIRNILDCWCRTLHFCFLLPQTSVNLECKEFLGQKLSTKDIQLTTEKLPLRLPSDLPKQSLAKTLFLKISLVIFINEKKNLF